MTEARVECVCKEYHLPELGLVLHEGQVVWLDPVVARKSPQLTQARRAGAVQVRWVARCEVAKQFPPARGPAPTWLKRRTRIPLGGTPEPAPSAVPADPDAAVRQAAAATRDMLRDVVREEVRAALEARPVGTTTMTVGVDADQIREAVLSALSSVSVVAPQGTRTTSQAGAVDGADPVFIPTGIVPTGDKSAITVNAETSSSGGVDDASAALKAARGGSKRKQKE